EEEPDREADVEEPAGAAVGLEHVEHLGELLAVECELPLGGEDVEPEVVRLRRPVLAEDDVLAHLRVDEDEPAHLAADEGEALLLEECGVVGAPAERAVDSLREALGEPAGRGVEELCELGVPRLEVAVAPGLLVQAHGFLVTPIVPMCRNGTRWTCVKSQNAGFQKTSSLTRTPPERRCRQATRNSNSMWRVVCSESWKKTSTPASRARRGRSVSRASPRTSSKRARSSVSSKPRSRSASTAVCSPRARTRRAG